MVGHPALTGCSVLVVEDDFYLAEDVRDALEQAGAAVLGPYATAGDALDLLTRTKPDCAIIDVNLGKGPSFEVARGLKGRDIPMIFATGYNLSVIPPEFVETPRLLKPVDAHKLVEAVARLCPRRPND